eukprot:GEMP01034254.1.p1 GENE.GEMP01034254.1~~GEMP01034254.1.p1  ORF type:complete len:265 (+),score=53.02 GEMP01034254.1:144-938(+)
MTSLAHVYTMHPEHRCMRQAHDDQQSQSQSQQRLATLNGSSASDKRSHRAELPLSARFMLVADEMAKFERKYKELLEDHRMFREKTFREKSCIIERAISVSTEGLLKAGFQAWCFARTSGLLENEGDKLRKQAKLANEKANVHVAKLQNELAEVHMSTAHYEEQLHAEQRRSAMLRDEMMALHHRNERLTSQLSEAEKYLVLVQEQTELRNADVREVVVAYTARSRDIQEEQTPQVLSDQALTASHTSMVGELQDRLVRLNIGR